MDKDCKNDLFIRDLGYVCLKSMEQIKGQKAFYLNRLQAGISLWHEVNGKLLRLEISKLTDYMQKHNINEFEKEVFLGKAKNFKTRLAIFMLPKTVIDERIRKAKQNAKKKGRTISKEHLIRMQVNLFITNVDVVNMSVQEMWDIYRLRWQVELIFKVWKSIGSIHMVKKVKQTRFESFIYARLIWIMLNWLIIWRIGNYYWSKDKLVLSIIKIFKHLGELNSEIRIAILYTNNKLKKIIHTVLEICPRYFIVERRKGKLSMVDILIDQIEKH